MPRLTCHVNTSTHLSTDQIPLSVVSKGISANMLKASSKRRRTQAQIKEEKAAAAQRDANNMAKDEEILALQQQIVQL